MIYCEIQTVLKLYQQNIPSDHTLVKIFNWHASLAEHACLVAVDQQLEKVIRSEKLGI